MELNALHAALLGISVHPELIDPMRGEEKGSSCPDVRVMESAERLLHFLKYKNGEAALDFYIRLFYYLRQAGCDGLGSWLWDWLRYTETLYSRMIDEGRSDPALENAARRDVETFVLLAQTDCDRFIDAMKSLLGSEYAPVLAGLPRWRAVAPFDFDSLTRFYREHGAGRFARWRAFLWERGELVPVPEPDCGDQADMIGYEAQREEVIANTRALVEGRSVNNVLLYGDSGTGKSATVKSLLTVPGFGNLRLIEADKGDLTGLPRLIRSLSGRRQKFILFIDDLAFDRDDKTYSALKTILEGGLEKRPRNVAVYATSNRRRLVRQTVSEREGDELDARETVDEKTALSERFGLRVAYLPLNKAGYLELVDRLAEQEGVKLDREALHDAALKWELSHPGRTPRTARQFLASLRL